MERGLMTGITRLSKESIFCDLNNLEVVTTTSVKYADLFGFTEKEVYDALDCAGMPEEGKGRYDVMMEPLRDDIPAIVLEFKVFNPAKEKNLEDTVRTALAQIVDKGYDEKLSARGISKERIRHYDFAFTGKKVLIGEAGSV